MNLIGGALTGVWMYFAAFALGGIAATSATYTVVHNANAVTIDELKLAQSQEHTANATASLQQLQSFISNMHSASVGYAANIADIDTRFAALQKGLHFAKPLPASCRPDTDRVRALSAAVAAANANPSP